jgi:serine protease Do
MAALDQNWMPALAAHLRRSSVVVRGREPGGGSGVIWNASGLIVTNAHVAWGKQQQVELSDGRRFAADVIARDTRRDLAALRIQANGLPAATVGDSKTLRVGEIVAAIGNPLGIAGALSTGIVHAIGPADWIQADVRLAPGNSGGILADASGCVIGINTMIAMGLALAIPSRAVEQFLKELRDGARAA